jgi:tetratricopeptide (TPR) repeat protein
MSRGVTLRFVLLLSVAVSSSAALAERAQAIAALNSGRTDEAIHLLQAQLAQDPHDALSHHLLCRAFYSIALDDSAIPECEAAVANAPNTSDNYLWLGRAYGLKAATSNPVAAFRLARKVVAAFEQAVKLDPANVPALSDLGEFYVAAPAIVGGGFDKAQQLSTRMMPVSATKAHRLIAMLAEKKGEIAGAEAEFRRAVEAQPSPASFVDLAAFYQRQKKNDQCVTAIQAVIRLDRTRDASLVDAASILTDADRLPQLAQQLLAAYLASPAKSDSAPAPKVHVQLGDLLLKAGDQAGARREYQAALALASAYAPAQKAIRSLPAIQSAQPKAIP